MNEKTTLEESYPALEVSDDLRLRVQRLAAESDATRTARVARKKTTRRVVLIGAMAGVAIAGIAVGPRVATAAELWRVQNALGNLKSAHIVQWQRTENGGREVMETWFSGNSTRLQRGDGSVLIFDGIYNYFYNPATKKVVRKAAEGPYAHNPSGFTADAIKRDMAGMAGWNTATERLGDIQEGGKTLQRIAFYHSEPAGKIRHTLFVEPETRLPQRMEINLQEKKGAWTPIGGGEFRYNETLPTAMFSPKFPGATLVDEDALRSRWKEQIKTTVVAETQLGARKVKVRDVQINPQGAIFVLYTCDKTWEDGFWQDKKGGWWSDFVRDWDLRIPGYRRLAMHFGGYYNDKEKRASSLGIRPVLEDGGRLQGDWFIPLAEKPTLPKQVDLEMIAHPANLHGDALAQERGTPFTQSAPDGFKHRTSWSATAKLSLAPTLYKGGFYPEYWPFLVSTYGSEELSQQYTETRQAIFSGPGWGNWGSYAPSL